MPGRTIVVFRFSFASVLPPVKRGPARLNRDLNRASRDIYRQKHDGQGQ